MVSILDEIRADDKLSTAAHWDDGNKIRDGILKRAPDEMIKYASQWTVGSGQVEEKTAEMINAAGITDLLSLPSCTLTCIVYYTGGAQHPPKQIKFDFYYMHCVNCSIFFSAFLKQPWISQQNKVRLLGGRVVSICACMPRAARQSHYWMKSPTISRKSRRGRATTLGWHFQRAKEHDDDGHLAKLASIGAWGTGL
jgi:hypothetical protein